jgi:hypothetical protein
MFLTVLTFLALLMVEGITLASHSKCAPGEGNYLQNRGQGIGNNENPGVQIANGMKPLDPTE